VVADICARLGGLPLAIELAAAWVRVLGVDQILERLDDTFELLVGGSRSAPTRQQTMRATLDWSYGLLAEAECVVFQRLSVFVGGWSLEAAENVCSGGIVDRHGLLARLTRLVDASLVHVDERDERVRYRLLEPVRQYAQNCLTASGELAAVRRQHAAYFVSFAQRWETDANVGGPGRQAAHTALGHEQDNLRAALRWCVEHGEAEMGLRLGRAHWNFWVVRGLYSEGRTWLTQLAALPAAANEPTERAVALSISASLASRQGGYATALEIYREVLPRLREAHDPWLLENALEDLGIIAMDTGDYSSAEGNFDQALTIARSAGDRVNEAVALHNLAMLAAEQQDFPKARALSEQNLALARELGDAWRIGGALRVHGLVVFLQGDVIQSHLLLQEAVAVYRQLGERYRLAYALDSLGHVSSAKEQYAAAGEALSESLQLRHEFGDRYGVAESLESIAALAASQREPARAVQLAGAAASIRDSIGSPLSPLRRTLLDQWLIPLRQTLGVDAIESAWEAGRVMSLQQALELALEATRTPATQPDQPPAATRRQVAELSPREQEVAALLAHGLTNRQIAERLVITERTVGAHIGHILDKLGFNSRHQIGVWASEHGMLD
jgi:non-specific serine/threonine protein kinase